MTIHRAYYPSEIGHLEVIGTDNELLSIRFWDGKDTPASKPHPSLREIFKQLDEYFHGTRREFHVKLENKGTDFQKKVWNELRRIPFGIKASYGEIASRIGQPKAARAVGNANNRNNIVIIIPCHRVIAGDGGLGGFGGGLWRKEWLLKHEIET